MKAKKGKLSIGERRRARVSKSKASRERVSAKTAHLMDEGKDQDEAVATALHMEEEGRLGPHGAYRRVSVGERRRRRRR